MKRLHHVDLLGVSRRDAQSILGNCHSLFNHIRRNMQNVLERTVYDVDQAEQNRHLDQQGQTARHWVVVLLLVKLHHLFIESLLIIGIAFLYCFHFGLKLDHRQAVFMLLNRKRIEQQPDQQREQHERDKITDRAVVGKQVDKLITGPHDVAERRADYIINELHDLHITSILSQMRLLFGRFFRNIVDAAFVEGIASQNTPNRQKPALACSKTQDCRIGIFGAGRIEPTAGRLERG